MEWLQNKHKREFNDFINKLILNTRELHFLFNFSSKKYNNNLNNSSIHTFILHLTLNKERKAIQSNSMHSTYINPLIQNLSTLFHLLLFIGIYIENRTVLFTICNGKMKHQTKRRVELNGYIYPCLLVGAPHCTNNIIFLSVILLVQWIFQIYFKFPK